MRRTSTGWGTEHVYRDPDTGRDVPASEAPSRAFTDSWDLVGHRVKVDQRQCARYDRSIGDAARRSRVQAARDTGNVVPLLPARTVRPRERREREHVARSTSSGDSGEGSDHEEPEPLRWADPSSWRGFLTDGLTFDALQAASSAAGRPVPASV